MPTAYTAPLMHGDLTLAEFAWRCARAFVPYYTEVESTPIQSKPADIRYYDDLLTQARADLREACDMSNAEADAASAAEYASALKYYEDSKARQASLVERLTRLTSCVRDWQPPTLQHEKLKHFMVNQLEEEMRRATWHLGDPPVRLSSWAWREEVIKRAAAEVVRAERALEAANAEALKEREWLEALPKSLLDRA